MVAENDLGPLEIKLRGLDLTPEVLRKQLEPRGSRPTTLLLAGGSGKAVAIVGRRIEVVVVSDFATRRAGRTMVMRSHDVSRAQAMVEPRIIDRGRGPEIAGTRITVFDILDYLQDGWHPVAIAAFFRISSREVDEAIRYIEEHKEEVLAEYDRILARAAAGNPPELQARLDADHAKFLARYRKASQSDAQEEGHEGHPR